MDLTVICVMIWLIRDFKDEEILNIKYVYDKHCQCSTSTCSNKSNYSKAAIYIDFYRM